MTDRNNKRWPEDYISVTKLARRGEPARKNEFVHGTVLRLTEKAVQFESSQLAALGLESPRWFPRTAIVEGENVDATTTELELKGWFVASNAE